MKLWFPRAFHRASLAACFCASATVSIGVSAQTPSAGVQQDRAPAPIQRIPRQQALQAAALDGAVRETISAAETRPIPSAQITLRNIVTNELFHLTSNAEGIFRLVPVPPGHYELRAEAENYAALIITDLVLNANEVLTLQITLVLAATNSAANNTRLPRLPELGPAASSNENASATHAAAPYREFRHRLDSDPNYISELAPDRLPPIGDVFNLVPNRWALQQPDYRRYPQKGEYLYTKSHWYDPFNRNKLKGDQPIWPATLGQQTFLNLTATS